MADRRHFISTEEIRRELERQIQESEDDDNDQIDDESSETEDIIIPEEREADEFEVGENENEVDGSGIDSFINDRDFFLGKDKETIWTDKPLLQYRGTRRLAKNIVTHLPGAEAEARIAQSELGLFQLFFDKSIMDKIVLYTNEEIERKSKNYESKQWFIGPTDLVELNALIGLLFMSGVLKDSNLNVSDLFSQAYGPPIFRATMSHCRFTFLLSALRFDSKGTRETRKKTDKFAAFREIWSHFNENCGKLYTPSEYTTVDESLLSFRGRCPFKMYMPKKPDKYGLKIVCLCDARTFYFCGGIPYIGRDTITREKGLLLPTQYVLALTEPIKNTNRQVTMDNWFSSCELAEELTRNKLTMVGTLRKNKREIPLSLISVKNVPLMASRFLYQPDRMLVSFSPKKNKNVILLSSMHDTGEVNNITGKPDIVEFYNLTKGGVDSYDQLCHSYTTKRSSRRWPMRFFFAILDTAGINSFVLLSLKGKATTRANFLKTLAYSLAEPLMKKRIYNLRLPATLRTQIHQVLGVEEKTTQEASSNGNSSRGRCCFCTRKQDKKTRFSCIECNKLTCLDHGKIICVSCFETLKNPIYADATCGDI